jgi:hypothetical protein
MPFFLDEVQYPDILNFLPDGAPEVELCRDQPGYCLPAVPGEQYQIWLTRQNAATLATANTYKWLREDDSWDTSGVAQVYPISGVGMLFAQAPASEGCYRLRAYTLSVVVLPPAINSFETTGDVALMALMDGLGNVAQTDGPFSIDPVPATSPVHTGAGSMKIDSVAFSAQRTKVTTAANQTFERGASYRFDVYVYIPSGNFGFTLPLGPAILSGLTDATFLIDLIPWLSPPRDEWIHFGALLTVGNDNVGRLGLTFGPTSGAGPFYVDDFTISQISALFPVATSECIEVGDECFTLLVEASSLDDGFYPYSALPPGQQFERFRIQAEVMELGQEGGQEEIYWDSQGTPQTIFSRSWRTYTLRTGYLDDVRHRNLALAVRHDSFKLKAPHWAAYRRYSRDNADYSIQPVEQPFWYRLAIATQKLRLADFYQVNSNC